VCCEQWRFSEVSILRGIQGALGWRSWVRAPAQWEDEEKEERVLFVLSYLKKNGFSIVKAFSKAFFTSDDENVGGEETNSSSLADSRKYCCW
jgi:hypothetical protein